MAAARNQTKTSSRQSVNKRIMHTKQPPQPPLANHLTLKTESSMWRSISIRQPFHTWTKSHGSCHQPLHTRTNPTCRSCHLHVSSWRQDISGVRNHQYDDDTQLHIAMQTANTDAWLSILTDCIMEVKNWYLLNGLQLNADEKNWSYVILVYRTSFKQHQQSNPFKSLAYLWQSLMRWRSLVLDSRCTFDSHVSSILQLCSYHAQVIHHVQDENRVQKLACSPNLLRLDYCNLLLYGVPMEVVSKSAAPTE